MGRPVRHATGTQTHAAQATQPHAAISPVADLNRAQPFGAVQAYGDGRRSEQVRRARLGGMGDPGERVPELCGSAENGRSTFFAMGGDTDVGRGEFSTACGMMARQEDLILF